jgi:3-oxoacyl-[acyl-carrier protein] reductase
MDLGLKGKVAMITGASKGLGRAMAKAFGDEGVKLSICARGEADLKDAAAELQKLGFEVLAMAADVTKPADMTKWMNDTVSRFGGVDIVVNNAGGATPGALDELSEEAWRDTFELNFFSAVRLARMAAEKMQSRGGVIVNISSIYGRESGGPLTYNSSKAAMISFTKMLARETASGKVRINSIAPGSIQYPGGSWERRFKESPAFQKDFVSHEMPAGRLGHPDEVAYAVVMLASPRASWINGAILPVDGAQGRSLI